MSMISKRTDEEKIRIEGGEKWEERERRKAMNENVSYLEKIKFKISFSN